MKQITSISNDAQQSMTVVLDDGSKLDITLQYVQANKGWYISIIYGTTLTINKRRVVTSPNMVRAEREIIPFGIACATTDGLEPIYKDDFTNGRASLYVLNSNDVALIESGVIST